MKNYIKVAGIVLAAVCGTPARAQSAEDQPVRHAVSTDLFASTDADKTEV